MSDGLFDDVPLMNKERDNSWEAFIKRKDVKAMFSEEGFGFPLNRGYYDLWCIAWAKAWDKGFMSGRDNPELDEICQDLQEKTYTQAMRIAELEAKLSEAEKQEPVAWLCEPDKNGMYGLPLTEGTCTKCFPVYTHPQPKREWVGLTDEDDIDWDGTGNLKQLVEAVEAKLKEKNT